MLQFKLNPEQKSVEMEVMLKGEAEPLNIKIGRYEIKSEDGKSHLELHDIKTSREWIDIVAKKYIENRKIDVPSNFVELMEILG